MRCLEWCVSFGIVEKTTAYCNHLDEKWFCIIKIITVSTIFELHDDHLFLYDFFQATWTWQLQSRPRQLRGYWQLRLSALSWTFCSFCLNLLLYSACNFFFSASWIVLSTNLSWKSKMFKKNSNTCAEPPLENLELSKAHLAFWGYLDYFGLLWSI